MSLEGTGAFIGCFKHQQPQLLLPSLVPTASRVQQQATTDKMSQAGLGSAVVLTVTLSKRGSICMPQFPHLYRDGLSLMSLLTCMVLEGFSKVSAFSQGIQKEKDM